MYHLIALVFLTLVPLVSPATPQEQPLDRGLLAGRPSVSADLLERLGLTATDLEQALRTLSSQGRDGGGEGLSAHDVFVLVTFDTFVTAIEAQYVNDGAAEVDAADVLDGSLTGADISTSSGDVSFSGGALSVEPDSTTLEPAIQSQGSDGTDQVTDPDGHTALLATGGDSGAGTFNGGIGIEAFGGNGLEGGGHGLVATGGLADNPALGFNGTGVVAIGQDGTSPGDGLSATGGHGEAGATGVTADGGDGLAFDGGHGLIARGGASFSGFADSGGSGVRSFGGSGTGGSFAFGGVGVEGTGGQPGGDGVVGTAADPTAFGVFAMGDLGASGLKPFVHPHPTDPSRQIRFVALEGNEPGTYHRGTAQLVDGVAVVPVPEDFRLVTRAEGLTAQVTAVGGPAILWIEQQDLETLVVRGSHDVAFHYLVQGVRRGFEDMQTIEPNRVFVPTVRGVPFGNAYRESYRQLLVENGILNPDYTPNEFTAARLGWTLENPDVEDR